MFAKLAAARVIGQVSGMPFRAVLLAFSAALLSFASARAQLPGGTADSHNPFAATPLDWEWKRLNASQVYFHWVANPGKPLILAVPAAPGQDRVGFSDHFARYLHDQGYALGVIEWRGDRARRQLPSEIVAQIVRDLGQARAIGMAQNAFDPNRILLFGSGEASFLATLLSADHQLLRMAGLSSNGVCATMLLHPLNLDPRRPDTYIARRQFAREAGALDRWSPSDRLKTAPPTLFIFNATDRQEEGRVRAAVERLRFAGRTAVAVGMPKFEFDDERTYLGLTGNRATPVTRDFLRSNCPGAAN